VQPFGISPLHHHAQPQFGQGGPEAIDLSITETLVKFKAHVERFNLSIPYTGIGGIPIHLYINAIGVPSWIGQLLCKFSYMVIVTMIIIEISHLEDL